MSQEIRRSPSGRFVSWEPIVDGDALPDALWENGSEKISSNVPLIIGSTLNEFVGGNKPKAGINTWDDVKADLGKTMGKDAGEFVDAFREAYPAAGIDEIYRLDTMVRPAALQQLHKRVADNGAPVWNYLFTYQLKGEDGNFHAGHNGDIPFYFNNVVRSANMTGATPDGIALGDTMSSVLINFARTGRPYAPGMPEWKPSTAKEVNTMIWNTPKVMQVSNHDKRLVEHMK
ncbi:carboxylesterase family protein [Phocaeicola paurosaccharolyticus]|uniref:carboxylesterase family protein n=1 Tax=Phocaeicola paurosaccharolyticus TaxID=732242 RepID=UPI000A5777B9|nr:carboxylesterase family protein [Phocaeicola paurosaccharolyticus]